MKKVMVRVLCMLTISLMVIAAVACRGENGDYDIGDMRGHLMVNGQLYWSSAYPVDNLFSKDKFTCVGEVTEEVCSTPTANFQAYNIASGAKIYYSQEYPQIVYVESDTVPYRFATVEASKDYLYYNQEVYTSLDSLCGWEYENYKNNYVPAYGDMMAVEQIPADAIYIGNTTFAGYNMPVSEELQTNAYPDAVPVYQDYNNPKMLYVGKNHMIYVPVM